MNIKPLTILLAVSISTGKINIIDEFNYTYQVISNSYAISDEVDAYYYKELLIDYYESLVFEELEDNHTKIIVDNINNFNFDDKCNAYYYQGGITLIIGKGQGLVLKGKLRKNACQEDVIREKIYIFDLFK